MTTCLHCTKELNARAIKDKSKFCKKLCFEEYVLKHLHKTEPHHKKHDEEESEEDSDSEESSKSLKTKEAFNLFVANHLHKAIIGILLFIVMYRYIDSDIEFGFSVNLTEDIEVSFGIGGNGDVGYNKRRR
jgi:hypothetical protein